MSLHDKIMNIQCVTPGTLPLNEHRAHKIGHRDARHAAAELALEADALQTELLEALKTLEQRIAYYASLHEGEAPNIEQWAYTDQSGDLRKVRELIAKVEGEQA